MKKMAIKDAKIQLTVKKNAEGATTRKWTETKKNATRPGSG